MFYWHMKDILEMKPKYHNLLPLIELRHRRGGILSYLLMDPYFKIPNRSLVMNPIISYFLKEDKDWGMK